MRYTLTVLALCVVNLLAWFLFAGGAYEERRLEVVAHPLLIDEHLPTRPEILWEFSHPIQDPGGAQVLLLEPALAGRWQWNDDYTELRFFATEDLPAANPLRARLRREQLRSVEGHRLAADREWTWQRAAPRLIRAEQAGFDAQQRYLIECLFNAPVQARDVLELLELSAPNGQLLRLELLPQADPQRVLLRSQSLLADLGGQGPHQIRLRLAAGLSTPGGSLVGEAQEMSVPFSPRLQVLGLSAQSPAEGPIEVFLRTNEHFDINLFEEVFSIEPAVSVALRQRHRGVVISGAFEPGQRYRLHIGAHEQRLPAPGSWSLVIPDRAPLLRVPLQGSLLQARGARAIPLQAQNLSQVEARLHRLYDHNLAVWRALGRGQARTVERLGRAVAHTHLALPGAGNELQEYRLPLDRLLSEPEQQLRDGVWLLVLEAEHPSQNWRLRREVILNLGDMGLQARAGSEYVAVWVQRLSDGQALAQAQVQVFGDAHGLLASGSSDAEGFVRLALPADASEVPLVIQASLEREGAATEHAWLDLHQHRLRQLDTETGIAYEPDSYRALIRCGRDALRPGEQLLARALVRPQQGPLQQGFPVEWRIWRPDGRIWRSQPALLDDDGLSAWDVQLPDTLPTGRWRLGLSLPGSPDEQSLGSTDLHIQALVPDRLVIAMPQPDQGHWQLDQGAIPLQIQAAWRFGAPAAGLRASLISHARPLLPTFREWSGWTFGDRAGVQESQAPNRIRQEHPPRICDDQGRGAWSLDAQALLGDFANQPAYGPWDVLLVGEVAEDGGRAVAASRSLLLHSGHPYPALRSRVVDDEHWELDATLVRPDGQATDGALSWRLYRERWENHLIQRNQRWRWVGQRSLQAVEDWQPLPENSGPRSIRAATGPGDWVIALRDAQGRIVSLRQRQAGGLDRSRPDAAALEMIAIDQQVVDGSRALRPGEQARIRLSSPFAGRVLISLENQDLIWWKTLDMEEQPTTFSLPPAQASWGTNVHLNVSIVRPLQGLPVGEVARARAHLNLPIHDPEQVLGLDLQVPDQLAPQERLRIRSRVYDAQGQPLADARVLLALCDQGWLDLTAYRPADPLAWYRRHRRHSVLHLDSWNHILNEVPESPDVVSIGGDIQDWDERYQGGQPAADIRVIADQSAWLRSDEEGWVEYEYELGAFAGTLQAMALAVKGQSFAASSKPVQVRGALTVQAAWPRFLAPGDHLKLPLRIHRDPELHEVPLSIQLSQEDGVRLICPPDQEVRQEGAEVLVSLPLSAGSKEGFAQVRLQVQAAEAVWEEPYSLLIRAPQPLTDLHGSLLVSDQEAWQASSLDLPEAVPGTVSWSFLADHPAQQAEAIIERYLNLLQRYPYGCAEQSVSRVFPLVALRKEDLDSHRQFAIEDAISQLRLLQTYDGGLAMWPGQRQTWPWASVYAADFLARAQAQGHVLPQGLWQPLVRWVERCARGQIRNAQGQVNRAAQAYALALLARMGRAQTGDVAGLSNLVENQGVDAPLPESVALHSALAWLYLGRRDHSQLLLGAGEEGVRLAEEHLASPSRNRALRLDALLHVDHQHPEVHVLAQAVAKDAESEAWRSTQEQAWGLIALIAYSQAHPARASHQGLQLLAGELDNPQLLAESAPGAALAWQWQEQQLPEGLRLQVLGENSQVALHWRRSAVLREALPATAQGLRIERIISSVDGRPLAQPLPSGSLIRVEWRVHSPQRIPHLVIEDMLPAGLIAENPLRQSGRRESEGGTAGLQIRDDRVLWFGHLQAGRPLTLHYFARTAAAGDYAWPGLRAEAMYDRALHAIGESARLEIVP